VPIFNFACSWKDGQAKLTWVADLNSEMIYPLNGHLSQHRVTLLMSATPLLISETTKQLDRFANLSLNSNICLDSCLAVQSGLRKSLLQLLISCFVIFSQHCFYVCERCNSLNLYPQENNISLVVNNKLG